MEEFPPDDCDLFQRSLFCDKCGFRTLEMVHNFQYDKNGACKGDILCYRCIRCSFCGTRKPFIPISTVVPIRGVENG